MDCMTEGSAIHFTDQSRGKTVAIKRKPSCFRSHFVPADTFLAYACILQYTALFFRSHSRLQQGRNQRTTTFVLRRGVTSGDPRMATHARRAG